VGENRVSKVQTVRHRWPLRFLDGKRAAQPPAATLVVRTLVRPNERTEVRATAGAVFVIYTSIHYASAKLTHRAAIFNKNFWPRKDWPDPTLLGQIDFDWGYLGDDLGPGGEIANKLVFMGSIVPKPAAVMLLLQWLSVLVAYRRPHRR
jgi:hypothetical protein